jgi:hypothetical protein
MNLHEFFLNFAHVRNGFFETTFSIEIGSKHALENSFNYEGVNVVFPNWHPEFSSNKENQLHYYNTCCGFNFKD